MIPFFKKMNQSKQRKVKSEGTKKSKPIMRALKLIQTILLNFFVAVLVGGIAIGACYGVAVMENDSYEVTFYHVKSSKAAKRTRIVFISDLHLKEYGTLNADLLDNIKNLNPDMIVLGGDLVTRSEAEYDSMLDFCRKLPEIAPTYGVPGNHEDEKKYLDGEEDIFNKFMDTGIHYLVNAKEEVKLNDMTFEICGVRGELYSYEQYGGKELMDGLEHTDSFRIVVAHIPYLYQNGLENYEYDLAFAGHTHGGIVRIPELGGLYSAEEGLLPEYTEGEILLPNDASLIISRGMGDSSKIVPRINNRHELCIIDINRY